MQISVCMGIYNGKKYIIRQLESIRQQTRQPDEVILCDDSSTDGTQELVRKYLAGHTELCGWRLYENNSNKGYPANFYNAMDLCGGDIVFLADQDDIWDLHKIERMSQIMEQRPDIYVMGCTFGLINEKEETIHSVMAPADRNRRGRLNQIPIGRVFLKCEWPGMVLAYRGDWWKKSAQHESNVIPHDFFLCARAAEEKGFYQLEELLAYHRRHEENAGGEEHRLARLLKKERKLKEVRKYNRILKAFSDEDVLQTEEGKRALKRKEESMAGRQKALESGKICKVLGNAWQHKTQVRLVTLLCDCIIVKQR